MEFVMHSSLKTKLATIESFEQYDQFKSNVELSVAIPCLWAI